MAYSRTRFWLIDHLKQSIVAITHLTRWAIQKPHCQTQYCYPDTQDQYSNRRLWRPSLISIPLFLWLTACSSGSDVMLLDYQQRVARVLELDIQTATDSELNLSPLPRIRARDMQLDLADQRIDLLDFLRLSNCALGRVIGQKNSSLGKMAAPSQRLHLERDILTLGPECVAQIEQNQPELATKLTDIFEVKRQQRMASWWNAWFTSEEWQQFINPGTELIAAGEPEPAALSTALQAYDYALQQGELWRQMQFDYDSEEMEFHQQQWLFSEAMGQWLTSQRFISRVSYQVANVLQQRQDDRPICPLGRRTKRSEILHTVFLKFYIGQFQPYVSRVDRFGAELLQRLEQGMALVAPPPLAQQWHQAIIAERQQMRDFNMLHVKAWQATLRQCGLIPTADS